MSRSLSSRFEPDPVAIPDGSRSYSSSAASSSASSSPRPPLPDEVLRSFQFRSQQRTGDINGGAIEARHAAPVRRVGQLVNTNDCDATASSDNENHADSGDAYSVFSDRGLDIIAAKLEAVAEELERKRIRDEKIRKIEALRERCKTLGVNISQHDLEAWVNESAATSGTIMSQRTPNQDETQAQADEPQDVGPVPSSEAQFAQDSEVTLVDDGPANISSGALVEPQTSLRSLRPQRGRKRARSQLEEQSPDADGDHDSDYVDANDQPPSPDRTESLQSEDTQNKDSRESEPPPMVLVDGVATRTAWSVLVARYPEEIALTFRAGQRPTNRQVMAMVCPRNSCTTCTNSRFINTRNSSIYLPSTLCWTIPCAGHAASRGAYRTLVNRDVPSILSLLSRKSRVQPRLSPVTSARKDVAFGRGVIRGPQRVVRHLMAGLRLVPTACCKANHQNADGSRGRHYHQREYNKHECWS